MTDTAHQTRLTFGAPAGLNYRAADGDAGVGSLSWRAPVFGVLSVDFGGWRELVLPSAVTRTMGRPQQIAQYNHTTMLASRAGGTLDAEVDDRGVLFRIADLPDTYVGQHVATMAERGDLTGASFTFTLRAPSYWASLGSLRTDGIAGNPIGDVRVGDLDDDDDPGDDLLVRVLTEIRVWESGPVDMPAYPEAVVGRARDGAAAELHAARGIPVDELTGAMAERRLGELITRSTGPSTTAGGVALRAPAPVTTAGGMSLALARELARPRYSVTD